MRKDKKTSYQALKDYKEMWEALKYTMGYKFTKKPKGNISFFGVLKEMEEKEKIFLGGNEK